jgi:DNA-binding LacI/PurR family transcriptional regulator
MAAHANPPLTTISQPKYHMGRLAIQLLRAMRTSDPTPSEGYVLLESPLIIRESTAPPRKE